MFFTYILRSESLGKFYVGHSQDLESRVDYHNSGNVAFTKRGTPWELVYSESFSSRSEAMIRENEIKRWKSATMIRRLIQTQRC